MFVYDTIKYWTGWISVTKRMSDKNLQGNIEPSNTKNEITLKWQYV